jgi:hypothetical protein
MSYTSDLIAMTLQNLDDNPDTWGDVLNTSAIELLEDALNTTTIDVTASDATLDNTVGGDMAGHYRYGVIEITGTALASSRNVNVPLDSFSNFAKKHWLVINNTTGGQTITFKTTTGTGVTIPAAEAQFCYCDGTDILSTSTALATLATNATTAVNSTQLIGVAGAAFAQLAVANTWTAGQVTQRSVLVDAAGDITPDLSVSNSFFHEMLQGENLAAPTNATNGAQFSLLVEQGVGAPWTLTYQASTFLWVGGAAPTLSTGVGDIDYLAFEYCTNVATTAKWIGSIIKGIS